MQKHSEVFLAFLEPLTAACGQGPGSPTMESVAKIGCTVWNALALDWVAGSSRHFDEVCKALQGSDPGPLAIVRALARRRVEKFREHSWVIRKYEFFTTESGQWRLRVESGAQPKPPQQNGAQPG